MRLNKWLAGVILFAGAVVAVIIVGLSVELKTKKKEEVRFIKGVDMMKLTKDRLENPLSVEDKRRVVEAAAGLGVNYVAVSTPYEAPVGDAAAETKEWVGIIRQNNLRVIHRHMFPGYEDIYGSGINLGEDYLVKMAGWIRDNVDLIEEDDIWVPMPEPQNAGIAGINCQENCRFENAHEFNKYIQKLVTVSKDALKAIGREEVKVVCCGFDLFIGSGNNNEEREGTSFLEPGTIVKTGCPAYDHYPQGGKTMEEDLNLLLETWRGRCFYLTETSKPDNNESINDRFKAFKVLAKRGQLRGVVWWPFNPGEEGNDEGLLDENFKPKAIYEEVRVGMKSLPDKVKVITVD